MKTQVGDTLIEIVPGDAAGAGEYYLVRVGPGALDLGYGKVLNFATTLGTISPGKKPGERKINVWTPAATVPRSYAAKAKIVLEMAANLVQFDHDRPATKAEIRRDIERATGVKVR